MLLLQTLLAFTSFVFLKGHQFSYQETFTVNYEELVSLNVSCSPKDTCAREFSKTRDLTSLNERNCACDSFCAVYGDCCIDAPARTSKPVSSAETIRGWVCRNLTQFGGIIMKNSCPASWIGSEEVRKKCETQEDVKGGEDPLTIMPVTNRLNGATYFNFHCAFCNDDIADSLFWLPRLEFDRLEQYNRTFQNITEGYVWKNLKYSKEERSWGISLKGVDDQTRFYPSKLYPVIPTQVERLVRQCRKSLISNCDETWLDQEVQDKCSSYEAAIYLHDLTKSVAYRNPHCAICNRVDLSKLVCKPPAGKSEVEQRTFNFNAFSLLVDFNDAKGRHVGQKDLCYEGEVYDPFQKICRNLFCGFPGYVLIKNKCVLEKTDQNASRSASTTTAASTFAATITSTTTAAITTISSSTIPLVPAISPEATTTGSIVPLESSTYDSELEVVPLNSNVSFEIETRMNNGKYRNEISMETSSSSPSSTTETTTGIIYNEEFKECSKVPIQFDNLETFANGTIYVIPYGKYYEPSEYLFSENQIWVCAFFINGTSTEHGKFSATLGYITVVGLSISMVCLALHLAVFIIIPDLRNLSNRNLSSFSVALLFAYLCFTIGNISSLSKLSCTFVGIAMCYFFLVTFFWMNTLAFDVWRTLRVATQELRVSSGKQWKRFVLYSAYAWGVPSAILSVALIVDNLDSVPNDFKPGFGARLCWFSERKALLVFFAAPLIVVILINIGFFVSSAKMIISTSHAASNHTASRRNFRLYLRLGVMMGLTWIFGIIAGYLDLETLWYIFILLNTLQGLFIFLAFTCNRKVRKHVVDRFQSVGKGRQAYRTSSLDSGSGLNYHSGFPSSNTSASRTMLTQQSDTKSSFVSDKSSHMAAFTTPLERSLSPFKQFQAGMETLY